MEEKKAAIAKEEGVKEGAIVREGKKDRGRVEGLSGTFMPWYMDEKLGLRREQTMHLKQARCPAKVEGKPATLVRIFDPAVAKEKGVTVEDYESLNEHPELILYEGYYFGQRQLSDCLIERRDAVGPSLLEKKMKEGAITEVGVPKKKTATQKWLSRIGTFMMMGGFILVLFLVLAIVVAVSLLTKGC